MCRQCPRQVVCRFMFRRSTVSTCPRLLSPSSSRACEMSPILLNSLSFTVIFAQVVVFVGPVLRARVENVRHAAPPRGWRRRVLEPRPLAVAAARRVPPPAAKRVLAVAVGHGRRRRRGARARVSVRGALQRVGRQRLADALVFGCYAAGRRGPGGRRGIRGGIGAWGGLPSVGANVGCRVSSAHAHAGRLGGE